MDLVSLLQLLLNGILLGGVYAMVALGLALCFGVLGLLNLAHGAFLVLAAYTYQTVQDVCPYGGLVGLLLIPGMFSLLGLLFFTALLRGPYRRSPENLLTPALLITLGLALILEDFTSLFWGQAMAGLQSQLSPLHWGELSFSGNRVLIFAIMVLLSTTLHLWLMHTDGGRRLRALAQDHLAATLMGISPVGTSALAFTLGTGLSALAGLLYVTLFTVSPHLGLPLTLKALFLVVVSGRGSLLAPLIGGLLLGVLETFVADLMGAGWASIIALSMLLAWLCYRPTGLVSAGAFRQGG